MLVRITYVGEYDIYVVEYSIRVREYNICS